VVLERLLVNRRGDRCAICVAFEHVLPRRSRCFEAKLRPPGAGDGLPETSACGDSRRCLLSESGVSTHTFDSHCLTSQKYLSSCRTAHWNALVTERPVRQRDNSRVRKMGVGCEPGLRRHAGSAPHCVPPASALSFRDPSIAGNPRFRGDRAGAACVRGSPESMTAVPTARERPN
jgi:hypothetical protein